MNAFTSIGEALSYGYSILAETSATARLDAELLLSYVTARSRLNLISEREASLSENQSRAYVEVILRRAQYEPLAYIVGCKEFWGLDLHVSSAVLVPRPETELLIEQALLFLETTSDPLSILDLGTGSGAIPVALTSELKELKRTFRFLAIDDSEAALIVAKKNLDRYEFSELVQLKKSDWFSAIDAGEKFDLILSNPPYIAQGDTRISKELRHEPQDALYAGSDGLRDIKMILESSAAFLTERGALMIEFGMGQETELLGMARQNGFKSRYENDLSKIPRVLISSRN